MNRVHMCLAALLVSGLVLPAVWADDISDPPPVIQASPDLESGSNSPPQCGVIQSGLFPLPSDMITSDFDGQCYEGAIEVHLNVSHYWGPTNPDGTLINAPSSNVRLFVAAGDIDFNGTGCSPERDLVYFNGQPLSQLVSSNPQYLHGDNNRWEINCLDIPLSAIRFPANQGGSPGDNVFRVVVDPSGCWCAQIDWIALDLSQHVDFEDDEDVPNDHFGVVYVSADDHVVPVIADVFSGSESTVYWAIAQGSGGSLSQTQTTTTGGFAHTLLTSSTTAGATYKVKARLTPSTESWTETVRTVQVVPGKPEQFSYELKKGAADFVSFTPSTTFSGGQQYEVIPAGLRMSATENDTIVVRITAKDRYGNLIPPGTATSWQLNGDGQILPNGTSTSLDAQSRATVALRAGANPGEQLLTFALGGAVKRLGNPLLAPQITLIRTGEDGFEAEVKDANGNAVPDGTPVKWYISKGSIQPDGSSLASTMVEGRVVNGKSTATASPVYREFNGAEKSGHQLAHGDAVVVCTVGNTAVRSKPFPFEMVDIGVHPYIWLEEAFLNGELTEDQVVEHETYLGGRMSVPMKAKGKIKIQGRPDATNTLLTLKADLFEPAAYWGFESAERVAQEIRHPFTRELEQQFSTWKFADTITTSKYPDDPMESSANVEPSAAAVEDSQAYDGSNVLRFIQGPCWHVNTTRSPYSVGESFKLTFSFRPATGWSSNACELWGQQDFNYDFNQAWGRAYPDVRVFAANGSVRAQVTDFCSAPLEVTAPGAIQVGQWNTVAVQFVCEALNAPATGPRQSLLRLAVALNDAQDEREMRCSALEPTPLGPDEIPRVWRLLVNGWECNSSNPVDTLLLDIDGVGYSVYKNEAANFNVAGTSTRQTAVSLDADGKATVEIDSAGLLADSALASTTIRIHASYLNPTMGVQEMVISSHLLNKNMQSRFKEIFSGVTWGEGEGAEGVAGDLAASMIPLAGDARDLLKNLAFMAPGGQEPDWATFNLSLAGFGADFAQLFPAAAPLAVPANAALASLKIIVKKIAASAGVATKAGKRALAAFARLIRRILSEALSDPATANRTKDLLSALAQDDELLGLATGGLIRNEFDDIDNLADCLDVFRRLDSPGEPGNHFRRGISAIKRVGRDFDVDTAREVAKLLARVSVPFSDDAITGLAHIVKSSGPDIAEQILNHTGRANFANRLCERVNKIASALPARDLVHEGEFDIWLRNGLGSQSGTSFTGGTWEVLYVTEELLKDGGPGLKRISPLAPDGGLGRDAETLDGWYIECKHWFPPEGVPGAVENLAARLRDQVASHARRFAVLGHTKVRFVFRGNPRQAWIDAINEAAAGLDNISVDVKFVGPNVGVLQDPVWAQ